MTFLPFQHSLFGDESMSSQAQRLANPLAKQESEKVQTMQGISFLSFFEWWQNANPNGSSLRTFTDCLISRVDKYSRRITHHWKVKVTPFKRYVFQLQPSMLRTDETDCGLLLTPTASENEQDIEKFKKRMEKYPNGTTMPNLATQNLSCDALLLTPTATERWAKDETDTIVTSNGTVRRKYKNGKTSSLGLSSQIERMLPTPNTLVGYGNKDTTPRHTPSMGTLIDQIPTPNARDWKGKGFEGQNLPNTIEMLPTPDANMGSRGEMTEWQPIRPSGHTASLTLNDAVTHQRTRQLPTPKTKMDDGVAEPLRNTPNLGATIGIETGETLQLQPAFVEWMMGVPLTWTDLNSPPVNIEKID